MSKPLFSAILLGIFLTIAAVPSALSQQKPIPAPTKPAAAATQAAEPDVLSQLQPAPTAAELALYKETKAKSPEDIRKFLVTRKYFRQIWIAFPDGKLDPDKAPPSSDDVDFAYALDLNEQMILFKVKLGAASTGAK